MIALNFVNKLEPEKESNRPFHLIELGPGRGTLMNDILRTFSAFPSFFKNVKKCSFVEISPHLRTIQSKNMENWRDTIEFEWSDNLEAVNIKQEAMPILIAQEFFDAIPIHVFQKTPEAIWKELKVSSKMCLVEQKSSIIDLLKIPKNFANYPNGKTLEISPSSWSICHQIRKIFDRSKRGEGIIIDYGHFRPSSNSLRAIYKHQFCSIFDNVGDADLSADVDFQSLMHYLGPESKNYYFCQIYFISFFFRQI